MLWLLEMWNWQNLYRTLSRPNQVRWMCDVTLLLVGWISLVSGVSVPGTLCCNILWPFCTEPAHILLCLASLIGLCWSYPDALCECNVRICWAHSTGIQHKFCCILHVASVRKFKSKPTNLGILWIWSTLPWQQYVQVIFEDLITVCFILVAAWVLIFCVVLFTRFVVRKQGKPTYNAPRRKSITATTPTSIGSPRISARSKTPHSVLSRAARALMATAQTSPTMSPTTPE